MRTGKVVDTKSAGASTVLVIETEDGEIHERILTKYEIGHLLESKCPNELSEAARAYMNKLHAMKTT